MTTQDIMIGDWVFFPEINRHVVVTTIYDNGIITVNDQVTSYLANRPITPHLVNRYMRKCDMFESIPITAEILEKNRWIYEDSLWLHEDAITLQEGFDGTNLFFWFVGGSPFLPINYVHELQHVLKLCRIDKTIEL